MLRSRRLSRSSAQTVEYNGSPTSSINSGVNRSAASHRGSESSVMNCSYRLIALRRLLFGGSGGQRPVRDVVVELSQRELSGLREERSTVPFSSRERDHPGNP